MARLSNSPVSMLANNQLSLIIHRVYVQDQGKPGIQERCKVDGKGICIKAYLEPSQLLQNYITANQ